MFSERRKASHRTSDDGTTSPFLNSPSPVPLSVLVTQQGSPPPTNKDSSSSPCPSISSLSYGHFTTNAANAATLIPSTTPTHRSANVSPQPRVFTIASLLNDPPPDQQPRPRPPPPPPPQPQPQQYFLHHHDHHHHHYHHHLHQKRVAHHLALQEKENRHHQNHASHPSPPFLSSDLDDETEMAPPKKPSSSQRHRPIPTPPSNLLDSPTSIDSEPAIRHTAPAPTSPARDEAVQQQQQHRLHQPQSLLHSQPYPQSDRVRQPARDRESEQLREGNQHQRRDQRGHLAARETGSAPANFTRTTVTTATTATATTTAANGPSVLISSVTSKKRQALPTAKSRVKPVEATSVTTQQPWMRELSTDDEKSHRNQDDADSRNHRARTALGKPATPQNPKVDAAIIKAENSSPRLRAVDDDDVKGSTSAKPLGVSVPQESNSSRSSISSSSISSSSSRSPNDSDRARTPEKPEGDIPRNSAPNSSVEDEKRKDEEKDAVPAKKLGPVTQADASDSPAKNAPLAGIHLADAMTRTTTPQSRVATPPPRVAKRSQSLSPFDNGPASPVKKIKTDKDAESIVQNAMPSSRQPSEDIPTLPEGSKLTEAADVVIDNADSPRAQSHMHTEATFRLVEPDEDVMMTSAEPEAPVAPEAMMDATSMGDMEGGKDAGEVVTRPVEIRGEPEPAKAEGQRAETEDKDKSGEMEASTTQEIVNETVVEGELVEDQAMEDKPMEDKPLQEQPASDIITDDKALDKTVVEEKQDEEQAAETTAKEKTPEVSTVEETTTAREKTPEITTMEEKPADETVAKSKTPEPSMVGEKVEGQQGQESSNTEQSGVQNGQKETLGNKVQEEAAPVQSPSPRKRKIVITKRSSTTAPSVNASPKPARKSDSFNGLPFIIKSHDRCPGEEFEFQLEIKRPGDTQLSWEEEKGLFLESPETVVKYWDTVPGGREEACEGMWKIYKIWDERKTGRKTKYQVGWVGSLERGWEWRNMLLSNAKEVLDEWEESQAAKQAKKEAKEEGTDYEFDDEQQHLTEEEDDDEPQVKGKQRRGSPKSRTALSKPQKTAAATAKRIRFVNRREQK